MLVNMERGIVIWTPFKNYSTSLHYYFDRNSYWWKVIGEQPRDGRFGPHCKVIDEAWKGYRFWLPLRNPYHRVVSIWKFVNRAEGYSPLQDWICDRINDPIFAPVTSLYEPVTDIFRCEDLPGAVISRGCDYGFDFPKHNVGGNYRYKLSEEDCLRIREVHESDFVAGGYDPDAYPFGNKK